AKFTVVWEISAERHEVISIVSTRRIAILRDRDALMEWRGLAGAEKRELRDEPTISHAVIKNYRVTPVRIRADSTQFREQRADERRRNSGNTVLIPDTKGVIHCLDDIVRA